MGYEYEEEVIWYKFGADEDREADLDANANAEAGATLLCCRECCLPLLPLLALRSSDIFDMMWFIEWFRSLRSSIAVRKVGERGWRRIACHSFCYRGTNVSECGGEFVAARELVAWWRETKKYFRNATGPEQGKNIVQVSIVQ